MNLKPIFKGRKDKHELHQDKSTLVIHLEVKKDRFGMGLKWIKPKN